VLAGLIAAWFGWQTLSHNLQWVEAGEMSRSMLRNVTTTFLDPARPATFYVANAPYGYRDVLLFNTGLDSAIQFAYRDWVGIRAYNVDEDTAQVQAALRDAASLGANPVFLMFRQGGSLITEYPSLQTLMEAPRD
jgi:hypothetical protein